MNITGGATLWARQTIESEIFFNKPDKWFKIWFYLVNKVNHKDNKQFKRGGCFVKYEWIAAGTGATKNEIDHSIRWFKKCKMLATQKATRGFIVFVLNYDKYQRLGSYKSDTESEVKATQKRNRSDTEAKQKRHVRINKNDIYDKNDKNGMLVQSQKPLCDTNRIFNFFCDKYKEAFGKSYIANFGKDKKLFKDLLPIVPADEIERLILLYFVTPDEYSEKSGYSVGMFKTKINSLRIEKRTLKVSDKTLRSIEAIKSWLKQKDVIDVG